MVTEDLQSIKSRLLNDIATRWAFLIMAVIMVSFLWYVGELENMEITLLGSVGVVVFLNIGLALALKKGKRVSLFAEYLIRVLDICLITFLIVLTGKINSPFYIMYILLIAMGGFSLNKQRIVYDFVISAFLYSVVLVVFDYSSYLVSINRITYEKLMGTLFVRVNFLALTAWMTSVYIDMIKKRQEELSRTNAENLKLYQKVNDLNQDLQLKIALATRELVQKNKENEVLSLKHQNLFINVVKIIALAAEIRDPYIRGHAERTTKYAQATWEELITLPGFKDSDDDRKTIFMACMMQDIGRLAVPDEILQKKSALTPEEWAIMKKQPLVGAQIIKQVEEMKLVSEAILHYRERYDGSGYPKGLKGDTIPLVSRLLAIVDAYDAMTTDKPYRPRKEGLLALEEIKMGINKQFDPKLAEAFVQAYEKGKIVKFFGEMT
jgi:HD-GYP domain-containing protein (c-di-GMP phosphodiesterase class II)